MRREINQALVNFYADIYSFRLQYRSKTFAAFRGLPDGFVKKNITGNIFLHFRRRYQEFAVFSALFLGCRYAEFFKTLVAGIQTLVDGKNAFWRRYKTGN